MIAQLYYCDHGHSTYSQVKYLPLGSNAGLYVCIQHYHAELQMRLDSKAWDVTVPANYPAWELLQVQYTDD
jgi:hypothetical protein